MKTTICRKCGKEFNQWFIDNNGKRHTSNHRKYCFICSPTGSKIGLKDTMLRLCGHCDDNRICKICGKHYKYTRRHRSGSSSSLCSGCISQRKRNRQREKLLNLFGNKCYICGFSKCKSALTFHHVNPKDKFFNIGNRYNRSIIQLKKEADKCVLLCKNCHAELQAGLFELMRLSLHEVY